MDLIKLAKDTINIEIDELISLKERIDNSFLKAIDIIFNTKGKLIVTGVGKSGLIGAKISSTLSSTGTSSFFLHPTEAMHGDLGMIDKTDSILAISYSGESEELINILPHIKRFDIPLISLTSNKNSTLAKYSDVTLDISVKKEACPLNIAPTSSTTITLALGDALASCLMVRKNFKKENFASFHPGGSLGKQLFVKVKDLVISKNLPIISKDTSLKDTILVMTEKKLGSAIIMENNKIIALISDGDLRRAMIRDDFSLDLKAIDIATKNPKTIQEDILASEALKIIEDYKIQLLIVVDKNNKLKGILHIHTLVEAGIK